MKQQEPEAPKKTPAQMERERVEARRREKARSKNRVARASRRRNRR